MPTRGKFIVLGMLLLAAALAGGNMIFQTRASGRAVGYWGSDAARLILTASQVHVLKLQPSSGVSTSEDYLPVGRQPVAIVQRVDIAQARGVLHFRRALIADSLYAWDEPSPAFSAREWRYGLQFREGVAVFTLLLPEGCEAVSGVDDQRPLGVRPGKGGASPLRDFIAEQFEKSSSLLE